MLKTNTWQTPFPIKDTVFFQTEKIIRKLTGIPLGTMVFVMRKLYIIEVKGLGLGSGEMLSVCLKGWSLMPITAPLEAHFSFSCPNMPISAFLISCLLDKLWSSYAFHYVWKKIQIQVHTLNHLLVHHFKHEVQTLWKPQIICLRDFCNLKEVCTWLLEERTQKFSVHFCLLASCWLFSWHPKNNSRSQRKSQGKQHHDSFSHLVWMTR